jgi:excisionase family DNA binding protein
MKRNSRWDDPMRQTYSVAETARILGVSSSTVRRGIKGKDIPIVRLGKLLRIPKWWVEQQLGRPSNEPEIKTSVIESV